MRSGEPYHYICGMRGTFLQPTLYEAFGLTVVAAICNGVPTMDRVSGFHPYHGDYVSAQTVDFYLNLDAKQTPLISNNCPKRIYEIYT